MNSSAGTTAPSTRRIDGATHLRESPSDADLHPSGLEDHLLLLTDEVERLGRALRDATTQAESARAGEREALEHAARAREDAARTAAECQLLAARVEESEARAVAAEQRAERLRGEAEAARRDGAGRRAAAPRPPAAGAPDGQAVKAAKRKLEEVREQLASQVERAARLETELALERQRITAMEAAPAERVSGRESGSGRPRRSRAGEHAAAPAAAAARPIEARLHPAEARPLGVPRTLVIGRDELPAVGATGAAAPVTVDPGAAAGERLPPDIDLLALSAAAPIDGRAASALLADAVGRGLRTVALDGPARRRVWRRGGPAWIADAGARLTEVAAGAEATVIESRVVNPVGFTGHKLRHDAWVMVVAAGTDPEGVRAAVARWERTLGKAPVEILGGAGLAGLPPHVSTRPLPEEGVLGKRARQYRGLLDHPALHASPRDHAERLLSFAAGGVPVLVLELPAAVRARLSPPFASALDALRPDALADTHGRERASIAVRRAALRDHSLSGRLLGAGHETVSVLLPSNRPDYLEHAIEQVNRQTYPVSELVLMLHGDAFPAGLEARLTQLASVPLTVLRAPASDSLGRMLNAGVAAASGTLVTKMDDDDWYATEHVFDLVLARDYSGADMVGKGNEFVYVRSEDVTLRRAASGGERWNHYICGGTLLASKDVIAGLGGWRDVPRAVDSALIEDARTAAARIYRTHGFGYLLNRHGQQHTWRRDTKFFLDTAVAQWPGLDLDAAGIEAGAGDRMPSGPAAPIR